MADSLQGWFDQSSPGSWLKPFLPISPNFNADSAQAQQVYQMTTEFCSSWCSWHLGDRGAALLAVAHIRILPPADFFWKDHQIRFCSAEPQ